MFDAYKGRELVVGGDKFGEIVLSRFQVVERAVDSVTSSLIAADPDLAGPQGVERQYAPDPLPPVAHVSPAQLGEMKDASDAAVRARVASSTAVKLAVPARKTLADLEDGSRGIR
jgi:hypothetical protein